jgi:Ca-activated chloride channel homolog
VNQAERKLRAVEDQLEAVEATEPPAGLLEAIQDEIPAELGAPASAGSNLPAHRWRLLAASLAMVAVGGVLGYRLLEEGPAPGDVIEPGTPVDHFAVGGGDDEIGAVVPPDGAPDPDGATATQPHALKRRVEPVGGEGSKSRGAAVPVPGSTPEGPREMGGRQDAAATGTEDLITITSELPLLDESKASAGLSREELDRIPTARSFDKILSQTPGVSVDPIAVGEVAPRPVPEPEPLRRAGEENAFLRGSVDSANLAETGAKATYYTMEELRKKLESAAPSTGGTAEPNDQPYGDMFFQGYGTNPFVDTEDDPQSTFGLDVDTASYTMARSYLRRGDLPPADAIRVEEFVNFFDYGDPAPRRHDFAVVAEGAPSPFAATARTYLLRFALKGREVSAVDRKPAVLTFVVDVSGSMDRENRLELVKQALRLLVGQLGEGDAVGLVIYGSHGQVLLQPTGDHARVLAAVDRLQPEGSTNAEEGLRLAYDVARRNFRPGAINRLILCSDGVANVGATGPESILARVAGEAERGVELTTVGFGMGNYNDVLMEQLADRGDGNYAYVDDLDAARRVFVENLTGTLETIAADAKVQVEFAPRQVQSYRLLGYENRDIADRDFRNDAVDAGEIGAGHQVTALYEVKLRDGAPSRGTLATLRLRYRSKASGKIVEDAVELDHGDLTGDWRRASHGLRMAAVAAEFAEILKGSYWVKDRSLEALATRARELVRTGQWDADAAELTELIRTAARLRGESPAPPEPVDDGGFERPD